MGRINKTEALDEAIALLEIKRMEDLAALKNQLHVSYESLKPVNILKNTFREVTQSPDLRKGIGTAAMGIASGYLMKNIFFHSTRNPLMKLAGMLFQTATTNMVVKNSDKIKESGEKIVLALANKFLSRKKTVTQNEHDA
jgi:hypothetical protein